MARASINSRASDSRPSKSGKLLVPPFHASPNYSENANLFPSLGYNHEGSPNLKGIAEGIFLKGRCNLNDLGPSSIGQNRRPPVERPMLVEIMNVPCVGKFDLPALQDLAICGGVSTHSRFCGPNFFRESIDVAQGRYNSVQCTGFGLAISLRGHHISVVEVARGCRRLMCWNSA